MPRVKVSYDNRLRDRLHLYQDALSDRVAYYLRHNRTQTESLFSMTMRWLGLRGRLPSFSSTAVLREFEFVMNRFTADYIRDNVERNEAIYPRRLRTELADRIMSWYDRYIHRVRVYNFGHLTNFTGVSDFRDWFDDRRGPRFRFTSQTP